MTRIELVSVVVTAEDIEGATVGNGFSCPIARAIKRQFDCDDARVGRTLVSFKNFQYNCVLPIEVIERVAKYDATGKMEPFSFVMYEHKDR